MLVMVDLEILCHLASAVELRRRVRRRFCVSPMTGLDVESTNIVDGPAADGAIEDDSLELVL
jgi:hypothetical protein